MIHARAALLVAALLAASACGPSFTLVYQRPSAKPGAYSALHAHQGFGLVGGGLLYSVVSPIFPRLLRYQGPIDLSEHCTNGFSSVRQTNAAEHNLYSAGISWLIVVDPYHTTEIEIRCAE
jgi:membrane-associated PAP2 superfamily phosphatase